MAQTVIMLMADYGNDPTEVATPYTIFTEAGLDVVFATEKGTTPACDQKMLSGITGSLLGAPARAKEQYRHMAETPAFKTPLSWTAPEFDLGKFDLVFLPGGHDKAMRQYIESQSLHLQLSRYVQEMRSGNNSKNLVAICHGVQVLTTASDEAGDKSIIHDFETTALPAFMEQSIYWLTCPFLGSYYKTYGPGTNSVEGFVKARLDNPATQWKTSWSGSAFTHRDPKFRYLSGRFPGDAEKLANEAVAMVNKA